MIEVQARMDRIPVFVKEGSIIPFMEPRLHAPKKGEVVNLVIRHYGLQPATYRLYDDDGFSFDFEKGAYTWRELKVTKDDRGNWTGSISTAPQGKPNTIGEISWRFMTPAN